MSTEISRDDSASGLGLGLGLGLGRGLRMTFAFPARFEQEAVEQAFRQDYHLQFAGYRRAAAVAGLLLWLAANLVLEPLGRQAAPFVYPDAVWRHVVMVRVTTGLAALCCLSVLFTRHRHHETVSTATVMAMVGVLAIGQLVLVFLVIPYPYNYIIYLPAFFGIVVASFAFVHLPARSASAMGLAFIVGIWVMSFASSDPGVAFGTALLPYLVLLVISHGIGVKFERNARERFVRERTLQAALQDEREARRIANEQRELLVRLKESERRTAERANRDKTRFLASAAHDLRQPVQALSLHLDLASRAVKGGGIGLAAEPVARAHDAARLLHRSLNSVLEISQLESGAIRPRYEDFDLRGLVAETSALLDPLARDNGVELRLRPSADKVLRVCSDRHLLGRVLVNLISNAIKYADAGRASRKVLVSMVRLPTRVRVDVVDNGIGIPRKSWDEIFEPFKQLDRPDHASREGLGLGLAIVNAAVGLLEGHRLEMRSQPGRGTRFSVDVPVVRAGEITPVDMPTSNTVVAVSGSLYVVLVEDDPMVRRALSLTLADRGVRFETAASFEELQALLPSLEIDPDAVLTDYRLSATHTAVDVIALVRRAFGRPIPTVILTAETGRLPGLPADGGSVVLRKPVQPEELLDALFSMREVVA